MQETHSNDQNSLDNFSTSPGRQETGIRLRQLEQTMEEVIGLLFLLHAAARQQYTTLPSERLAETEWPEQLDLFLHYRAWPKQLDEWKQASPDAHNA